MGSPNASRWPWFTVSLAGAAVATHGLLVLAGGHDWAWLDSARPLEVWRFLTAHWVHVDTEHLAWNVAALLLIGSWIEAHSRATLAKGLAFGTVGVSVWFYMASPTPLYCGLSGVLNTLVIMALALTGRTAWKEGDRYCGWVTTLVAAGVLGKVGIELTTSYRWVSAGIWPSAPGAHAMGLVVGLLWTAAHLIHWRGRSGRLEIAA